MYATSLTGSEDDERVNLPSLGSKCNHERGTFVHFVLDGQDWEFVMTISEIDILQISFLHGSEWEEAWVCKFWGESKKGMYGLLT
jgi:hypothetical protein